jgi:hypothetical protein
MNFAVFWLRRPFAGFSPQRPEFYLRPFQVRFLVEKLHWDRLFSEYLGFSPSLLFRILIFVP